MRSMATHVAYSVIFTQKGGKLRDGVANEILFSHKQCTHDLKYLFCIDHTHNTRDKADTRRIPDEFHLTFLCLGRSCLNT